MTARVPRRLLMTTLGIPGSWTLALQSGTPAKRRANSLSPGSPTQLPMQPEPRMMPSTLSGPRGE